MTDEFWTGLLNGLIAAALVWEGGYLLWSLLR